MKIVGNVTEYNKAGSMLIVVCRGRFEEAKCECNRAGLTIIDESLYSNFIVCSWGNRDVTRYLDRLILINRRMKLFRSIEPNSLRQIQ